MLKKHCKICGKEFQVKPYRNKTAKYCSRKCASETLFKKGLVPLNKKPKIKKRCMFCGKEFKVKNYRERSAKFCSHLCLNRAISKKGNKHWNWRGGINLENERLRHSLEWRVWRNEVYQRDNWICRLCGTKSGRKNKIVAHHIKLFSEFPELRFSVDNGITLCRICHNRIHKKKT